MIPGEIDPAVRSRAERHVFQLLQNAEGTDSWTCLHSLGLARHPTKRFGEIDFLLMTRKGIFVLEVKGGRVSRENGLWVFTDRNGKQTRKHEGPFQQASSAMFALEDEIRKHFGRDSRLGSLLYGYGVLFPDIQFESAGCEGDGQITYDLRDRRRPITAYIDRLAQFTQARQPVARHGPTGEDIKALTDFLRGDFDLVPPLCVKLDESTDHLLRLTEEQYAVLDDLHEYPRSVIQGGAGTGKTLLAGRAAQQELNQGKRVLFLCYNRTLAGYLSCMMRRPTPSPQVTVDSVHHFMERLIRESPTLWHEFQVRRTAVTEEELYRRLYPEFAHLATLESGFTPYDVLILDEAQDMLCDQMLDAFDSFIHGGLETGRWRAFMDINNQAAVYSALDPAAVGRLTRFGTTTPLTVNCRNTRPIAEETNMLAAPRRASRAKADGIPVEYTWYRDEQEQEHRLVELLGRLQREGVAPGRITVLSPFGDKACAARLSGRLVQVNAENAADVVSGRTSSTTYSTVSSFKGLENDYIILSDVTDLAGEWSQSVVYVGMSRARVGLHMLIHRRLEQTYNQRLREHLSKVIAAGDQRAG